MRLAALLLLPLLLASCGSISALTDSRGQEIETSARKFSKATVRTVQRAVPDDDGEVAEAQSFFTDHIVMEMQESSGFRSVTRNAVPDADTLVVDGTITRLTDGNAALRFLIGMGAGTAYFGAKVQFKDSQGTPLGDVFVNLNSFPLGGVNSAFQTPHKFMINAAEAVAEEAKKLAR